jgi:hypothetical protein
MDKRWKIAIVVGLVMAVMGAVAGGAALWSTPAELPIARSGGIAAGVYKTDGGDKLVVQSNGEIEIQSGGTLDVQSGATADLNASVSTTGTLTADDLVITDTVSLGGNISSASGAITITDDVSITGTLSAEDLSSTDDASVTDDLSVGGDIISDIDITGTLQYGSDDLTPLAYDSTTQYEVYVGSADSVTQTTVTSATHNCATAVDWGICFVSDPDADAGDPAYCTISISGTDITFQALDDDGDNASTAATKIYYMVIGR